ncbi:MAG: hypothetical protein CTY16_15070 [Methylobacter sp.]|nr:MAG: hypothetical protein CTY16_15070 [Methylobacter sp.]
MGICRTPYDAGGNFARFTDTAVARIQDTSMAAGFGDWRLAIGDNIVGTSGPHIKYLRRDGGVLEVRITFNAVKA